MKILSNKEYEKIINKEPQSYTYYMKDPYQAKKIEELESQNIRLEIELDKKDKKIERLNNIINELEKYINEEYAYDDIGMKIFDASKLQDKLQELKGSDKE